jgi:hypothetical protein
MGTFQQNFNTITNILILTILILGSLSWADSNGVWIFAKDIQPGTFGSDELGYGDPSYYYTFNNPIHCIQYSQFDSNVSINGTLYVDTIKSKSGNGVNIELN